MRTTILLYGVGGGLLVAVLKVTEYRFLVVEHSLEIYGGMVALIFATVGIWLGRTLADRRGDAVVRHVSGTPPEPFRLDADRLRAFGMTPREYEILGAIAEGLSTREIAARFSVSENTVKTHAGRVLEKLGANRRTQAVQIAKQAGLIA